MKLSPQLEMFNRVAWNHGVFLPVVSDGKVPHPDHIPSSRRLRYFNSLDLVPDDVSNVGFQPTVGTVVFDFDNSDDVSAMEGVNRFSELFSVDLGSTFSVRTPSGGFHFYFIWDIFLNLPGNLKLSHLTDGAVVGDVRCSNRKGYVLAPGSVVNGKEYTILNNAEIEQFPSSASLLMLSKAGIDPDVSDFSKDVTLDVVYGNNGAVIDRESSVGGLVGNSSSGASGGVSGVVDGAARDSAGVPLTGAAAIIANGGFYKGQSGEYAAGFGKGNSLRGVNNGEPSDSVKELMRSIWRTGGGKPHKGKFSKSKRRKKKYQPEPFYKTVVRQRKSKLHRYNKVSRSFETGIDSYTFSSEKKERATNARIKDFKESLSKFYAVSAGVDDSLRESWSAERAAAVQKLLGRVSDGSGLTNRCLLRLDNDSMRWLEYAVRDNCKDMKTWHEKRAYVFAALSCCYSKRDVVDAWTLLDIHRDSYQEKRGRKNFRISRKNLNNDYDRLLKKSGKDARHGRVPVCCFYPYVRGSWIRKLERSLHAEVVDCEQKFDAKYDPKRDPRRRSNSYRDYRVIDLIGARKALYSRKKTGMRNKLAFQILEDIVQPWINYGVSNVLLGEKFLADHYGVSIHMVRNAKRLLLERGIIYVHRPGNNITHQASAYRVNRQFWNYTLTTMIRALSIQNETSVVFDYRANVFVDPVTGEVYHGHNYLDSHPYAVRYFPPSSNLEPLTNRFRSATT